jgi:hypothetical protein
MSRTSCIATTTIRFYRRWRSVRKVLLALLPRQVVNAG